MIELPRSRLKPFAHQLVGVEALVDDVRPETGRIYPGCFFIADEPGAGKTKQVIDAAQVLFERDLIDQVMVIAPSEARIVWSDPEIGELAKHLWSGLPATVTEHHQKLRTWIWGPIEPRRRLRFIVTNYEFVRSKKQVDQFTAMANSRTLAVFDESSALASRKSAQSKVCLGIRRKCGRVVLLNGTPVGENPGDLFSQARMMDWRIIGCRIWTEFKTRYAVMERTQWSRGPVVVGWQNVEEIQRLMAPYVLRRLKDDCMDLPKKLPPTTIAVTLKPETWKIYKEMRDELCTWLTSQTVSVSIHAAVKVMRLSQVTSGILGGVEREEPAQMGLEMGGDLPDFMKKNDITEVDLETGEPDEREELRPGVVAVGDEKVQAVLAWVKKKLQEDPTAKMIFFCRFRPEADRLASALKEQGLLEVGLAVGGQSRDEREAAVKLLKPGFAPEGPAALVCLESVGARALDLSAASYVMHVSSGYSLLTRTQSDDRPHRTGQTRRVWYGDLVAVGPKGQKTVDHSVVRSLLKKEAVANWTTSAWVTALKGE